VLCSDCYFGDRQFADYDEISFEDWEDEDEDEDEDEEF
jgi:hypothetical protein